jgi:plasmid stabilization system protein ParE
MVQINWTDRAKEDIKSIADHIAKDSIYYAEKQVERLFDAVEILAAQPEIGHPEGV